MEDLQRLGESIADWADTIPELTVIYLFGSRVRGDHRPNSDVDLLVDFNTFDHQHGIHAWMEENQTEFAALKSRLPGPLQLHADNRAPEYLAVMSHKSDRALKIRKVVCVRTPPKPGLPGQARQ